MAGIMEGTGRLRTLAKFTTYLMGYGEIPRYWAERGLREIWGFSYFFGGGEAHG